ncbi:MAG: bifunctional serine/threonine-protein kinase/formylglycine-generating enzyme family protein, partial [Gemmatimonadota bacterium]
MNGYGERMSELASALAAHYKLDRELGHGGMATVYLAEDLRHSRTVAIKVLKPELAAALGRERFLREIKITARLHHPHILPLYDSDEAQGFLFYVMPYIAGESLRDLLDRETQLPVDEAVQIAREVADALGYAHSHNVLHRDIKPENILLDAGHAVVADFGIARAITEAGGSKLTETGLAIGTPTYMSPEQAAGGVSTLDARTDIYSLGCVLYEMLAGDPPFTGSTPIAILARKSMEPPPPLRIVRPAVPPAVDEAINKALATTPADRFRTTDEFAKALTATTEPQKPAHVRAAFVAPLTLAVVVGAVSAGWLLTRASNTRWAREEAIPRLIEMTNAGDYVAAFQLAARVEEVLPEEPTLATLWPQVSRYTGLRSEPAGAVFEYREYGAGAAEFVSAGTSPDLAAKIPLGFFHWRIHKPGYESLELASAGVRFPGARDDGSIHLYEEGTVPTEMVAVTGGAIGLSDVPGLEHAPVVELDDYLLDRYEVTNRQFKEFVDAGGYGNERYWREPFVKDGREVSRDVATAEFLDATGRPGPAGWQVGTYPEGRGEHPVGGISWYEAAAYAAFAGKELPTIYHWRHAADSKAVAAYIVPLGNYGDDGPLPVKESSALGPYGTYDMAGNVREWSRNQMEGRRLILGGAWGQPSYFYVEVDVASAWNRSPINGMRLMRSIDEESVPPAASRTMKFRSAT